MPISCRSEKSVWTSENSRIIAAKAIARAFEEASNERSRAAALDVHLASERVSKGPGQAPDEIAARVHDRALVLQEGDSRRALHGSPQDQPLRLVARSVPHLNDWPSRKWALSPWAGTVPLPSTKSAHRDRPVHRSRDRRATGRGSA